MGERASAAPPEADPQSLSNMAWSCATLLLQPAPLLASMSATIMSKLGELILQDVHITLWSHAQCRALHDGRGKSLGAGLVGRPLG